MKGKAFRCKFKSWWHRKFIKNQLQCGKIYQFVQFKMHLDEWFDGAKLRKRRKNKTQTNFQSKLIVPIWFQRELFLYWFQKKKKTSKPAAIVETVAKTRTNELNLVKHLWNSFSFRQKPLSPATFIQKQNIHTTCRQNQQMKKKQKKK